MAMETPMGKSRNTPTKNKQMRSLLCHTLRQTAPPCISIHTLRIQKSFSMSRKRLIQSDIRII